MGDTAATVHRTSQPGTGGGGNIRAANQTKRSPWISHFDVAPGSVNGKIDSSVLRITQEWRGSQPDRATVASRSTSSRRVLASRTTARIKIRIPQLEGQAQYVRRVLIREPDHSYGWKAVDGPAARCDRAICCGRSLIRSEATRK